MISGSRPFARDHIAQVGIGTLIIFIAMVLIASVAASVLMQTSSVLQQQAHSTGKQATQEVSSNLVIKNIEGVRSMTGSNNMSGNISLLKVRVGLNVGSSPIDLNQLIVSISDGTSTNDLIYANNERIYGNVMANFSASSTYDVNLAHLLTGTQADPGANGRYFFTAQKIRDDDLSFSQITPIINSGDLVTIYVSVVSADDQIYHSIDGIVTEGKQKDSDLNIAPRTRLNLVLTPDAGAITVVEFLTPSSYGTRGTITLYP
ncbi:MAG: flagellin [Methanolobus sp.]|nr:flagellin [Methanolobus sp.]